MPVLSQKAGPGSCIISESDHGYSRDTVTVVVPADVTYGANTVLGQVTADKTFVQYDPGAADGSETVAAILIYPAQGTSERTVISRHAQVKSTELVWFDGASPAQIVTAHTELSALGIIAR